MNRTGAWAAVLTTMLSSLAACSNRAGDCHDNGNCGGAHPAESTSSTGGHGGASSSSTGTGGSGGAPDCSGDPAAANIDEACAIFAEPDATGAAGTRASPVGDLDKAIELAAAAGKRVYACGDFDGPLAPTKGFDLWGGFKCKGGKWTWGGADRSKLGAPDDQVPVVVDVAGTVSIHTFSITADSAVAAGGSSIAVVFGKQVDPTIDCCDLTTGVGSPGDTTPGTPTNGAAAVPPTPGLVMCSGSSIAKGGQLTCADGTILKAGDGGDGGRASNPNGTPGGDGTIDGMPGDDRRTRRHQRRFGCANGQPGTPAIRAPAATAASPMTPVVDVASKPNGFPTGVVTVGGGAGKKGGFGTPGQPGAGGGGAAHTPNCRGGVGGGGMTGGCGGSGGLPGARGRLQHRRALPRHPPSARRRRHRCRRRRPRRPRRTSADRAGAAASRPAGITAGLSSGASTGCSGASGGNGGAGGSGGGGRGGHAIRRRFFMGTPTQLELGSTATWMFGAPGDGGVTVGVNKAEPGVAASCWNFDSNSACP